MNNLINNKIQTVFEEKTHTVKVRQDKRPPMRSTESSNQLYTANTRAEDRQKHHGSENRQTAALSARASFDIKTRITAMAQAQGLSESAVIMALVKKALQVEADLQYGALLEPIVRKTIKDQMTSDTNRVAYLASQAYYSAEEARILVTKLLSIMIRDGELIDELLSNTRKEARLALQNGNSQR